MYLCGVTSIGNHTELQDYKQGSAGALETMGAMGCFTRDVETTHRLCVFRPAGAQQGTAHLDS
jgi:hypothetical protein